VVKNKLHSAPEFVFVGRKTHLELVTSKSIGCEYIMEIKSENKCSRCGFDLSENIGKYGCRCNTAHPDQADKSGNNIMVVELDYQGYKKHG